MDYSTQHVKYPPPPQDSPSAEMCSLRICFYDLDCFARLAVRMNQKYHAVVVVVVQNNV